MNRYKKLANAIILQATKDYRELSSLLRMNPNDRIAEGEQLNIEKFFKSDYFIALTDLDGEQLLKDLQADIERSIRV